MELPGEMWQVLTLEMRQNPTGIRERCGYFHLEKCGFFRWEKRAYILRGKCGLFAQDECSKIPPGLGRDGGPFPPGEMRPFPHWKNAQNSAGRDVAISAGIDVVISAGRFAAKFRWDQMGIGPPEEMRKNWTSF